MTDEFHSDRPRFRPQLTPDLTAVDAFVVVSRWLLDDIRHHEPHVRDDRHPEHLHRFRVAVRRQRATLSHFKQALDPSAIRPFREGFARVGRATGGLRDLDVDLEARPQLLAMLPDDLRGGLLPRYAELERRRQRELGHVRHTLTAPWYLWMQRDWSRFLEAPAAGRRGTWPVLELVQRRLRRTHRRILEHGHAITPASPDASLHRLRIRGKKLRYLLELSASLHPPDQVTSLLKHLKRLQKHLGEFNDLSVQWEAWRTAFDQAGSAGETAAVAALLDILATRQERVRGRFESTFEAFAAPEVQVSFRELAGS